MRRPVVSLVAIVVVALAFVPSGRTRAGASGPLRLTVGTLGAIGSLDPRHGGSVIAQEVWNLQYPTLTSLDPKTLDPRPGVASAWSPMPGGRGWIYNLRRGLTWSDGQPVTADDVVYSLQFQQRNRQTTALRMFYGLRGRALSERSVEVTWTTSVPRGPSLLLNVVPKHVFETNDNVDTNVAQLGVSDGTWHVVATSPDSVQLQATAATGGPTLFQIGFRTYPTSAALIDAFARKQVDVISGVPTSDIEKLEGLPHVTVNHASDGTQYVLSDSLPDARTRQAISLAVDRSDLVTDVVNGAGTPGVMPLISRGATWALDSATVDSLTAALDAQPNRARELLARSPKLGRKLVVATGTPDPTGARVAAFVRRALNTVGLETETGIEAKLAGRRPDVFIDHLSFAGYDALAGLVSLDCRGCSGLAWASSRLQAPDDLSAQIPYALSQLRDLTAQAKVVGLFEPDTLQAFRTDNVTGFLRDPEIRSLVVFGPTVSQYAQLAAAPPPPGEQLSNTSYAVGAVIVLMLCVAAFLFAAWIRRRFANPEGAT